MSEDHSDVVTFTDPEGRTVSTTRGSDRHVEHLTYLASLEAEDIADGVPIVDEPDPVSADLPVDPDPLPADTVDVEVPATPETEAAPKRSRRPRAAAES
ncbi:hypothetical protein [Rhodococcus sp. SGAir0479]|uniref:hypothetical protein n=1 Tax=Rhodococcus sp. SGAir0479 TaxID=2567884 RepID=UPI0010CCCBC9|nr:hypothetical protein [Rhodococcus sp. SGAir0479]QCQ91734.1 hypothetical protein E7742_11155 [Rhodococcus sp. SGAir0479]